MRKLIIWFLPAAIVAAGVLGLVALKNSKPQPTALATEEKMWTVAVERVSAAALSPQLSLYGRVESPGKARLTAAVSGDVLAVHVQEGEVVAAQTELVTLDARETQLLMRQRQADVAETNALIENEMQRHANDKLALVREEKLTELAARSVRRATDLARKNVGSQSNLDASRQALEREAMALEKRMLVIREHRGRLAQLQARLVRAEALRDRANLDLTRARIRAPFSARVTSVKAARGNRVQIGEEMISLFDIERMELRVQIPTPHLRAVKQALADDDAKDRLTAVANVDGNLLKMRLDRLGGEVAKGSGGVFALFAIVSGGDTLQLGRLLSIKLDLPKIQRVFALPPEAVYGSNTAYRLVDGRMQSLAIERHGAMLDAEGSSRVLVSSAAAKEAEDFIVNQLPNAVDGLKVRVTDPRPQSAAN